MLVKPNEDFDVPLAFDLVGSSQPFFFGTAAVVERNPLNCSNIVTKPSRLISRLTAAFGVSHICV